MKTNDNGRAEARLRANRRLHRMTVGTALAAVAATGGLGWLAAVTYDGAPKSTQTASTAVTALVVDGGATTVDEPAVLSPVTADDGDREADDDDDGAISITTPAAAAAPAATPAPVAATAPPVSNAGGAAVATTGGS